MIAEKIKKKAKVSDLISREGLINKAEYEAEAMPEPFKSQLPVLVAWLAEKIPSEDPERKIGKWVVTNEFDDCCYAKCNQCNVTQIFYYGKPLTNYCPNCGSYNGDEEDE